MSQLHWIRTLCSFVSLLIARLQYRLKQCFVSLLIARLQYRLKQCFVSLLIARMQYRLKQCFVSLLIASEFVPNYRHCSTDWSNASSRCWSLQNLSLMIDTAVPTAMTSLTANNWCHILFTICAQPPCFYHRAGTLPSLQTGRSRNHALISSR
jgi:hypothetical protein